jgi:hypothetical protein
MSRAAYPVPPFRPFSRSSLRISSCPPRHVASLPCHVSRGVPSDIVPPLPTAIAPHPVASAAPRRVTSRPRGVYTPPRWDQIGSTPVTIYPRVLGQLVRAELSTCPTSRPSRGSSFSAAFAPSIGLPRRDARIDITTILHNAPQLHYLLHPTHTIRSSPSQGP